MFPNLEIVHISYVSFFFNSLKPRKHLPKGIVMHYSFNDFKNTALLVILINVTLWINRIYTCVHVALLCFFA